MFKSSKSTAVAVVFMFSLNILLFQNLPAADNKKDAPKLQMAAGYSTNKDTKEAVKEACARLVKKLGKDKVKFAILYSTIGFDQNELIKEARRLLPKAKIYGYTSIVGTMTNDGFHVGSNVTEGYSLSIMGFASDKMAFGVGYSGFDEKISPREAGKLAVVNAIKNASKNTSEKPKLVMITTVPFGQGVEEDIIAGIEDIIGKGTIPIVGGIASGDEAYTGGWGVFANDSFYTKGVVVAPIYTDLKIGYIYLAGFNPTESRGTVTAFEKGQERIIKTIDDKPAGVVLNDWLGGMLQKHLGTSDIIIPEMGVHPLGLKIVETGGYINWSLIYPWWYHPDNSLTVGVSAPKDETVYLLEGNPELLIKRPGLTARLARSRGRITEEEIAGVVMDHCGGTMRAIPRNRVPELVPIINEAIGNAPFIGTFNSGNYGCFSGVGNRYGNMMVNMIVFGKD